MWGAPEIMEERGSTAEQNTTIRRDLLIGIRHTIQPKINKFRQIRNINVPASWNAP